MLLLLGPSGSAVVVSNFFFLRTLLYTTQKLSTPPKIDNQRILEDLEHKKAYDGRNDS